MSYLQKLKLILLTLCFVLTTNAQQHVLIHSHNDYKQTVPFYQAYAQHVFSIEADIYSTDKENELLVAHDIEDLKEASTLDELYIQPIVKLFQKNGNRPWKDSKNKLQLLIDIKTKTEPTLTYLVKKLQEHPNVFNPNQNPLAVCIVITGNSPKKEDFQKYPDFIYFDGRPQIEYTHEQLKRIALISDDFHNYTNWNGKGAIIAPEEKALQAIINKAHTSEKKVRFWGVPDGITAWNTLHNMGVDLINTDEPEQCSYFFKHFERKNYGLAQQEINKEDLAKAKRLDKATASFKGFNAKQQFLSKPTEVYHPSFSKNTLSKKPKNIIFLIGDGMGLAQVCAAKTVNGDLSMLQLKEIGLLSTHAKDQYTTDSAGAGSSLATGESNCNRHISMSETGEIYPSITELLAKDYQKACGVVTSGNLADATPAAFYGHSLERNNTDEITAWLTKGNLTLLNGSGMEVFTERKDKKDLLKELSSQYTINTKIDQINKQSGKVICVDEELGDAATEENLPLLAKATHEAIKKLESENNNGFFLMVEGAKIDYAGHANSLPASILETLSFDLAVSEALRFADENGETLVIITGDHETGGLTLIDGSLEKKEITAMYQTNDHTPIMLPVYSYGPGSELFKGIYHNTQIFHKILQSLK